MTLTSTSECTRQTSMSQTTTTRGPPSSHCSKEIASLAKRRFTPSKCCATSRTSSTSGRLYVRDSFDIVFCACLLVQEKVATAYIRVWIFDLPGSMNSEWIGNA